MGQSGKKYPHNPTLFSDYGSLLLGVAFLLGLYLANLHSHLQFHTLVEIFSVVIACGIFVIAWNTRRFLNNNYLLFIGIASLFVAAIDLLHALSFKNMGVFQNPDVNLASQLRISARYLHSVSLLLAPFCLKRKLEPGLLVSCYTAVVALALASIFVWPTFPDCFIGGIGPTPFAKASEYAISLLFVAALVVLIMKRRAFDRNIFLLLSSSIVMFITARLAFALYADGYGTGSLLGHFSRVIGFYLVYRAMIATGLVAPYNTLFRELKESEEKFSKAFRTSPMVLTISSLEDGRYVEVNEAFERLLKRRREEVIGHTSIELDIWAYPADRAKMVQMLREREEVRNLEFNFKDRDGNAIWALYSATTIEINGEQLLLSMVNDMTERKRIAGEIEILNTDLTSRAFELELANQELEAFSYTVSHDLRAPLTNISSYSQILQACCGEGLDEQCLGYIRNIFGETERMDQLISTLLNFSRLSRNEITKEQIDLGLIAEVIAAELQLKEPERRVECVIAKEVTAVADRKLMQVVLENLLGNAWKYSGKTENPVIEFGVKGSGDNSIYFVRDNGAGFDMAYAEKMFTPFCRLPGAGEFKGHGIGLATVQRIIQRHGGRVWAEGAVGGGATIYFTL